MAADLATRRARGQRAALRRRPPLELRRLRVARARPRVRHQRLRRDAAGPWEWDVKRLAASVEIAGRDHGLRAAAAPDASCAGRRARVPRGDAQLRRDAQPRGLVRAPGRGGDPRRRWRARRAEDRERAERRTPRRARRTACARCPSSPTRSTASAADHQRPAARRAARRPRPGARRAALEERSASCSRAYRRTLRPDRRHLLERYRFVDIARKVVGVGSVGTRAWIVLLLGRDDDDPLVLQVKEARPSVLEPYAPRARYANQGQRVVEGQRLMQAASDMLLGWLHATGSTARRATSTSASCGTGRARRRSSDEPRRAAPCTAQLCGWTLARAHARSGDRIAIAAYLGRGRRLRPGARRRSPRPTPTRTSATTASSPRRSAAAASPPRPAPSDQLRASAIQRGERQRRLGGSRVRAAAGSLPTQRSAVRASAEGVCGVESIIRPNSAHPTF